MNTVAKYTPSPFHAEGNKNKKPKKKLLIHTDISTDKNPKKIILSKPVVVNPINLIKDSNISYHIENILNTDPNLIQKTKNMKIFLCIYRIKNYNHMEQCSYIEYLLYKYPPDIKPKRLSNNFSFPFVMTKKNETPFTTANNFFYKITDGIYGKEKSLGFLEMNNSLYFFYKTTDKSPAFAIEYYNSTQELWWTLIDEICNHKKVINFPIYPNVTNLFYQNPTLIYLYNAEKKRLEIPSVGYIGGPWISLPAIARSVDPNTPNIERFFGSFVYAIRYGGWTDNFKSLTVDGEEIANKKGKYKQGGIVRFAIFLNKPYVVGVTDKDLEKYIKNPNAWRNNFKSLFIGKIKYKNKIHSENSHFKVETFAQQVPLSYHRLDMLTLKKWNPQSTEYRIE